MVKIQDKTPSPSFPWPVLVLMLAPGAGAVAMEKLDLLPAPWGILTGLTAGMLLAGAALRVTNR